MENGYGPHFRDRTTRLERARAASCRFDTSRIVTEWAQSRQPAAYRRPRCFHPFRYIYILFGLFQLEMNDVTIALTNSVRGDMILCAHARWLCLSSLSSSPTISNHIIELMPHKVTLFITAWNGRFYCSQKYAKNVGSYKISQKLFSPDEEQWVIFLLIYFQRDTFGRPFSATTTHPRT